MFFCGGYSFFCFTQLNAALLPYRHLNKGGGGCVMVEGVLKLVVEPFHSLFWLTLGVTRVVEANGEGWGERCLAF